MKRNSKLRYTVKELTAVVPLDEYLEDCVDIPKFLACCEVCPNYGGSWSCPPHAFDPMERWRRFSRLHLYGRMLVPNDRGQRIEDALRTMEEEKLHVLERMLAWEGTNPGSMALAAGSCTLCEPCARKEGLPCQYPGRMRYSIEALGGDVGLAAQRYLGYPILWIKEGALPEYLMLVGGLLLP